VMMSKEKKKCVWMTSGLISYKLCAYEYLCEECMFDRAMRNEAKDPLTSLYTEHIQSPDSLTNRVDIHLVEDFFYHKNHCWAKVENPDCVRIGIDGILARCIMKIKTVVLPQVGDTLSRGICFSHIIQQRHIVPLISPLTGSILSVNSRIEKTPELLINDFWDNGWLITVKPKNLESDLRTLVFGKTAFEWYKKKEQEIIEISNAMLNRSGETLGATMQDGGEIIPNLADILNSEQYYQILESLSQCEDVI
jgi:glycine cleavage system H protein